MIQLEVINNKNEITPGDLVISIDSLHSPTMNLGIVTKINTKFLSIIPIYRDTNGKLNLYKKNNKIAKHWCKVNIEGFPLEYQEFYKTIK